MAALKIILLVLACLLLIYAVFSFALKVKKRHDLKKKQKESSPVVGNESPPNVYTDPNDDAIVENPSTRADDSTKTDV